MNNTFEIALEDSTRLVFVAMWEIADYGDRCYECPAGVAIDAAGQVYVTDFENHHHVKVFSHTGQLLSRWGTPGEGLGELFHPYGIAVGADDRVYVVDSSNARIQVFTCDGMLLTAWGSEGTAAGQFQYPAHIAISKTGQVYVADTGNDRIQCFMPDGTWVTSWGRRGMGKCEFLMPSGLAFNAEGDLFVSDLNGRIQRITPEGQWVAIFGHATPRGQWNSSPVPGEFDHPEGMAFDAKGRLYIADEDNHRVQVFTAEGDFLGMWGSRGRGIGQFYTPRAIAVSPTGRIYIADFNNHRVQVYQIEG